MMVNPISGQYMSLPGIESTETSNTSKPGQMSFSELLKENLQDVNDLQLNADQITKDFALGKVDDIHDVTIATEKAQLALNLTASIQNKIIGAYKEVMRMQI